MSKPTIVQLRIYKGAQIVRGEDNKIINENQTLKLRYDTKEWHNFIDKMYRNGWGRVTVEAVKTDEGGQEKWSEYKDADSELFKKIDAEVQAKLKKTDDKPLTQDQKEIAALTAQVKELVAASKGKPEADKTPSTNKELDAARARHLEVVGKEPHHASKLESINKAIEDKLSE